MTRQFLRQCSVSLTGSTSLSIPGGGSKDLRIEFAIGASTLQAPNAAKVRISNQTPQTIASFKNKEYQDLTIQSARSPYRLAPFGLFKTGKCMSLITRSRCKATAL